MIVSMTATRWFAPLFIDWYDVLRTESRVESWCRNQMGIFSALLATCTGNSPATGEFPAQRPVTQNFNVSFDLLLNKRLSKQSWGWRFETPSRPLWRHCSGFSILLQQHPESSNVGTVIKFYTYFDWVNGLEMRMLCQMTHASILHDPLRI